MIDPHTWAWPQYTEIGLIFFALAIAAAGHGKPKEGTNNFPLTLVGLLLTVFILSMGGFFGVRP